MKKFLSLLLLITILLLSSCKSKNIDNKTPSEITVTESPTEETTSITNWKNETYNNLIDNPNITECHNIKDMIAIMDYNSFYETETYNITLASNYEYYSNSKSIDDEMFYLYEYRNILSIGFTYTVNKNVITINANVKAERNTKDSPTNIRGINDLFYNETKNLRDANYNDFSTEDANKKMVDVYNTEQLWFAAQSGYRINAIKYTSAYTYYNLCKDVLRNICSDSMTNEEKYEAIYNYVIYNVDYDYGAMDIDYSSAKTALDTERIWYEYKASFIEDFFDNKLGVCDCFSKVITLLSNMEGIECYRIGVLDISQNSLDYDQTGHAYNYVKYNDKYYLSDITWGLSTRTLSNGYIEIKHHNYYLCSVIAENPYTLPTYFRPVKVENSNSSKDYYLNKTFTYNNKTYNLVISSLEEATALFNYVDSITISSDIYSFELYLDTNSQEVLQFFKTKANEMNLYYRNALSNNTMFFYTKNAVN